MSSRDIVIRLTDDEIRKLHLPISTRPTTSLNSVCQCPVCRLSVKREPVK
jgi:hypothetical protein